MTSSDEDSDKYWAEELQKLYSKYQLSSQELERRERAAQRLKEVYSSIPWYKEQVEKHGDEFWRALQARAVLAD